LLGREGTTNAMLQPIQLKEVSVRYSQVIGDIGEFLLKAGLTLGAPETLHQLAAGLRNDPTFRRDVASHIWVALYTYGRDTSNSDLLAIVAIAAAGMRNAAEANEHDAHSILRFIMETRRSFDTDSIAQGVILRPIRELTNATVVPFRAPVADEQTPDARVLPLRETSDSLDSEEEIDTDRRPIAWAVAACVLAALLIGFWFHRTSNKPETPLLSNTSTPPQIATPTAQPTVAPIPAAPKPSPITHRKSHNSPQPKSNTQVRLPETDSYVAENNGISTPPANNPAPPQLAATPSNKEVPAPRTPQLLHRPSQHSNSNFIAKASPPNSPGTRIPNVNATFRPVVRPTSLGTMAANVMYSPAPTYPADASAAHVQGEVKVEAEVDRDGNVASTRVISGPPLLREAAADAVQRWRYRPYLSEGKPISMSALVVLDFQLQ
jgi:TonB family protein